MNSLSERLLTIANMIDKGESVADIGTDHGYLPIHLLLNDVSPFAILTDISGGSLNKAKINCQEFLHVQKYELREGDGLEILTPGEVDVVVMAGIGGLLMIEILDWDLEKSHSYKKLILQPRNNGGALRKYLAANGFTIDELRIIPEGDRFCEIMSIHPGTISNDLNSDYKSDAEWEFPDDLIGEVNSLAKPYLEKCLAQEEVVIDKIRSGMEQKRPHDSTSAEKDIAYRKERIERLKDLLSRL